MFDLETGLALDLIRSRATPPRRVRSGRRRSDRLWAGRSCGDRHRPRRPPTTRALGGPSTSSAGRLRSWSDMLRTTTTPPRRYTTRSGSSGNSSSKPATVRSGVARRTANRAPVEREHRARVGLLARRVPLRPLLGLGQPRLRRAPRREPERRGGVVGPRQRNPAAVAADLEPPVRAKIGSWRASSARSSTSGSPSSSPAYRYTQPGRPSSNSAAARARRVPTSMSTTAWEFSSELPMTAPCVTASARPNRVTERWASWLFIVHAGRRPAGISASTVERTAARNASAFQGASIRSNANDWWNSSSLAYWRMMSGRRGA